MKRMLLILLLLQAFSVLGQGSGNANMSVEMTREAYYPQGDDALYKYIFNHLTYSEEAKKAKVTGQVMIAFYVEKDSALTEFRIISDVGFGVGEQVKEVLKKVKYVPALINGKPFRSKVILNVPVRAH